MFKRTRLILSLLLLVIILTLAACGGTAKPATSGESQPAPAGTGNVEAGKKLFNEPVLTGSPGCVTCHSLEKGKTLVGPSLGDIAAEAEADLKKPEYTGKAKTIEEILKESILEPDVFVTAGFPAGVMPKTYNKLSAQELNDLVAYLLTLK